MAIDVIWAWRKRRDLIRRRGQDLARFYMTVHGDAAVEMLLRQIKRYEPGSFDHKIHRQAERTLRQADLGSVKTAKPPKPPAPRPAR